MLWVIVLLTNERSHQPADNYTLSAYGFVCRILRKEINLIEFNRILI